VWKIHQFLTRVKKTHTRIGSAAVDGAAGPGALQVHQSLREKLSSRDEAASRLNDDLAAANRRHGIAEDELASLRASMQALDNDLLVKTMSLDQALRVRFIVDFYRSHVSAVYATVARGRNVYPFSPDCTHKVTFPV